MAVPAREAHGAEVAAVYAGLRQAVGAPIVNLVWRRVAATPGAPPLVRRATRGGTGAAVAQDFDRMAA